jgi:hypothetical protein
MASMALSGMAGAVGSAIEGGSPTQMLGATLGGGLTGYGMGKAGFGAADAASKAGMQSGMPLTQGAQAAVDATTQGMSGVAPQGVGSLTDAATANAYPQTYAMPLSPATPAMGVQGGAQPTFQMGQTFAPTQAAAPVGIPGATPPISPTAAAKPEKGFWSKLGDFTANHPDKMIPLALGGIRMLNGKKQQPLQQQARPTYQTATASTSPTAFNNYRAQRGFAQGGVTSLISGPGDGMSDSIPAYIQGGAPHVKEPIKVTDGEYIVSADVVSGLGNGSTEAGARKLDQMMAKVRSGRTGKKKQAPAINANKYLPA